jgi:hypothetical protein
LAGGSLGTGASWVWHTGSCSGPVVGTGTLINSGALAVTTTFYVGAQGPCNSTSCASVTVYIAGPTTTGTICPGQSVNLSALGGISGTGAVYEWYIGACGSGGIIGTGSSIIVSPTSNTQYFVRRVGSCNTTGCVSAIININTESVAPTSISASETSICAGGSSQLTLSGGSLGTGADYQWYAGGCGSGSSIGSGTSIIVSPGVTTTYYVRVEGLCNSTTCFSRTITVYNDPLITTQPVGTTICAGGTHSMSIVTSGGIGTMTYQWQNSANGSSWTNISGATSSNYTTPFLSTITYYHCVVSASGEGCGSTTSNTAIVIIEPDPNISVQPTDPSEICIGGTSDNMIVELFGGTGAFSYQWQYFNGSTWGNVSNGTPSGAIYTGGTANTFHVASISVDGSYQYRCIITQAGIGCGSLTSNTVTLIVAPSSSITASGSTTICSGGDATILSSTDIEGAGTLIYQWQSSFSAFGPWTNIPGANDIAYHAENLDLTSPDYYRVLLSSSGSGCANAISNVVQIFFQPDPSITVQPMGGAICLGGSIVMSVSAIDGVGDYQYVWQYYNGSIWVDILDSPLNTYTASPTSTTDYQCIVVTDGSGCDVATSNPATVIVNPFPTITCPPTYTVPTCNAAIPVGAITPVAFIALGGATNATSISYVDGAPTLVGCTETTIRTYTATLNSCTSICTQTLSRTILSAATVFPANGSSTVLCPASAVAPSTPVVADACGNNVPAVFVNTVNSPNPLTCEGTRTYNYTYTDCAGNVSLWSYIYTVNYSSGLHPPADGSSTVSCPANATDPGPPANIIDACGRTVVPVLIGSIDVPNPVSCDGTRVWTYRYTACDVSITADWTYTYTIDYSGGLTPPSNGFLTVSCPTNATDPGPPVNIADACGQTVVPVLIGSIDVPNPVSCEGTRVWTYRYTACDVSITADWTYTYTID